MQQKKARFVYSGICEQRIRVSNRVSNGFVPRRISSERKECFEMQVCFVLTFVRTYEYSGWARVEGTSGINRYSTSCGFPSQSRDLCHEDEEKYWSNSRYFDLIFLSSPFEGDVCIDIPWINPKKNGLIRAKSVWQRFVVCEAPIECCCIILWEADSCTEYVGKLNQFNRILIAPPLALVWYSFLKLSERNEMLAGIVYKMEWFVESTDKPRGNVELFTYILLSRFCESWHSFFFQKIQN